MISFSGAKLVIVIQNSFQQKTKRDLPFVEKNYRRLLVCTIIRNFVCK